MANFEYAIKKTLKHEGGYNEVKGDAGGATNYGISLRFLKSIYKTNNWVDVDNDGDVDANDIKNLSENQAKKIYYEQFWLANKCIYIEDDEVAAKFFDMTVNMGGKQAAKLLQQALNHLGYELAVDGVIGQGTLSAINKATSSVLLTLLRFECIIFYRKLTLGNPELMKFLKGWHARAIS
jgi:lysozyme family protein